MHIAFAGTPEFATVALRALIDGGHQIVLVLTQPDRPAGRGMKLAPSPVKQLAMKHDIAVHQPSSLKTPDAQAPLAEAKIDVLVVAAYGLILPTAVLALPRLGCLNIHASLLPRWRGAAPIQRAILAGDTETGVCIMQMEGGLDTGPVLLSHALPITPEDTGGTLHDRLAVLGATLIVDAVARLGAGRLEPRPQPVAGGTYAHKISKKEAEIDWSQHAKSIELQVRAFNPFPVARTHFGGEVWRIWSATVDGGNGFPAGTIMRVDAGGVLVACGVGALNITELQTAGGRRMNADAFIAGRPLLAGQSLK